MDDTDIDKMSSETDNEYVIMKYNCKAMKDMCEDNPDREPTFTRELHEWNWYHWNRNLRGQINAQCGVNAFYTRPYAKIGGKTKSFPFKAMKSIGHTK
eukprot:3410263-Ditylum_brightwellii.AAC.1